MPQPKLPFFLCLLAYTLVMRLLPYILINCDVKGDFRSLYYPWNFSPVTTVCLFGGAFVKDRRLSFLLPLATLFLSNIGIAALSGHIEWGFPARSWGFTYAIFAVAVAMGMLLRGQQSRHLPLRALSLGLGFEVLFFVTSNFLVWLHSSHSASPMYAPTAIGLSMCYVAAIPFFGRSLLGTATFSLLLFSPFAVRVPSNPMLEKHSGTLAPVHAK